MRHETARSTEASLRQAISDARALLKDLRQERREVEALMREIVRAVEDRFEALMAEHVKAGLDEYQSTIREAMNQAAEKVGREFDKLAKLYLTGDPKGRGQSLDEIMRERRGARS